MPPLPPPLRFLVVAPAGWIGQQQREVIDYLQTENRVLREQLGPHRLRFTNDQRVRLAAKAKLWSATILSSHASRWDCQIVEPSGSQQPAACATAGRVMTVFNAAVCWAGIAAQTTGEAGGGSAWLFAAPQRLPPVARSFPHQSSTA